MIHPMLIWSTVAFLLIPWAFAADDLSEHDLSVKRLWAEWKAGDESAYERLIELGPEARVLAHHILKPPGQIFHKWPESEEEENLIEAMRADAIPELIRAVDRTSGKDRIRFIEHLESLGRMARPAGDILMETAIEAHFDGESEAALRAMASAHTKKDFLIPEAIRMLSSASSRSGIGWPDQRQINLAKLATELLLVCPDERARTSLISAIRFHPDTTVRSNAGRALVRTSTDVDWIIRLLIDCLNDDTERPYLGQSTAENAIELLQGYQELPASAAVRLIEKLYRESFEGHHLSADDLADVVCRCPPTNTHATELVTNKLRPLLDDGAYIHNEHSRFIQIAAARVVLKWNPNEKVAVDFMAKVTDEMGVKDFSGPLGTRIRDERAFAARVLGNLGPPAKEHLPMLRSISEREKNAGKEYSELSVSSAWAIAQIDPSDTKCVPVLDALRDEFTYGIRWDEIDRVLGERTALLADLDDFLPRVRAPDRLLDETWEHRKWEWNLLRPHLKVVLPILLEHLKSNRTDVRIATARLLGEWQVSPDITIPAIAELLVDRYASVRAVTAESLAKFGPAAVSTIPKLERATLDQYLTVKLAAEDALSLIQGIAVE